MSKTVRGSDAVEMLSIFDEGPDRTPHVHVLRSYASGFDVDLSREDVLTPIKLSGGELVAVFEFEESGVRYVTRKYDGSLVQIAEEPDGGYTDVLPATIADVDELLRCPEADLTMRHRPSTPFEGTDV